MVVVVRVVGGGGGVKPKCYSPPHNGRVVSCIGHNVPTPMFKTYFCNYDTNMKKLDIQILKRKTIGHIYPSPYVPTFPATFQKQAWKVDGKLSTLSIV